MLSPLVYINELHPKLSWRVALLVKQKILFFPHSTVKCTKIVENNIAINHLNVFHFRQVQLHTIKIKLVFHLDAKGLKLSLI